MLAWPKALPLLFTTFDQHKKTPPGSGRCQKAKYFSKLLGSFGSLFGNAGRCCFFSGSCRFFSRAFFLDNRFFDLQSFIGELIAGSRFQIRIQTAVMLNRTQRFRADSQFEKLVQSFAEQRNYLQVRHKTTTAMVVSMANIISAHNAGAGNITFFNHYFIPQKQTRCLLIARVEQKVKNYLIK